MQIKVVNTVVPTIKCKLHECTQNKTCFQMAWQGKFIFVDIILILRHKTQASNLPRSQYLEP